MIHRETNISEKSMNKVWKSKTVKIKYHTLKKYKVPALPIQHVQDVLNKIAVSEGCSRYVRMCALINQTHYISFFVS